MGFFDFWKRWRKKAFLVGKDFESYSYFDEENQPILVYFDWDLAQEQTHSGYPFCQRVIVILDTERISEEGIPLEREQDYLAKLEKSLLQILEKKNIPCRYVAKLTYRGVVEFVFQVEKLPSFEKVLFNWKANHKEEQIEVKGKEGWSFFDKKIIPPSSLCLEIKDKRQIKELKTLENNNNPPLSTNAMYLFLHSFTGEATDLEELAQELSTQDFACALKSTETPLFLLQTQRLGELHEEEIRQFTQFFEQLSNQHQVVYQGWKATLALEENFHL